MRRTTKLGIAAALAGAALVAGCSVGTIVFDLGAGGSSSTASGATGGTGGTTSSSSSSATGGATSSSSTSSSSTSSSSGDPCGKPCGKGCATTCDDGQACTVAGDCTSGHCVNGICCNQDCAGSCRTCTAPDHVGTCVLIPAGVDGTPSCGASLRCNGSGSCAFANGKSFGLPCSNDNDCIGKHCGYQDVCVLATGALCNEDAECESALCLDHTCTNCATNADCPSKSCNAAKGFCRMPNGFTCGVAAACADGQCNDSQCALDNGMPCAADVDCASVLCTAGICTPCMSDAQCATGKCINGTTGKACASAAGAYCSNDNDCKGNQCDPSPVVAKCQ